MEIRNSNLDLNLYKVFYTVAQTKSISKAAEILYVSQPDISYRIKTLEKSLGGELFYRTSKGVQLTPEAEKLYEAVKDCFQSLSVGEKIFTEEQNLENGELYIRMQS